MKLIFAVLTGLTLTMVSLIAQETAGVASATDGSTNKVALEDLLKLPGFTNHAGMVLVKLSDSQWIGAYEVRQAEYQEVAGSNPSAFPGASHPVESVSWTEAMAFCARLTEAEKTEKMLPEGFAYTLPTQAQWEGFAASAELKDAVTSANETAPARRPWAASARPARAYMTFGATCGNGVWIRRTNRSAWRARCGVEFVDRYQPAPGVSLVRRAGCAPEQHRLPLPAGEKRREIM